MLIRIRATGALLTDRQFRDLHPSTSFPAQLTPATLDHFGADPVLEGLRPIGEPWQQAEPDGVEEVEGLWFTKYRLEPENEPTDWLDRLKAGRIEAVRSIVDARLAAGAAIPAGETTLHVALDDGSRADMGAMATTALAVQVTSGAVPWPESYQTGWITIENIRIPLPGPADGLALAAAVGVVYATIRQHGRDLKDAILAAENGAALAAIDIEDGWPG